MHTSDPLRLPRWAGSLSNDRLSLLFSHLFPRAKSAARRRLNTRPLHGADEEDIALSAFWRLCSGLVDGRIDNVKSEEELWQLLRVIVRHKVVDYHRREQTHKRGRGKVRGESAFGEKQDSSTGGIGQVCDNTPDAAYLAMFEEQKQQLLSQLNDSVLQQIAVWKLEDRTNQEIAQLLGICVRTVERKVRIIRKTWWVEIEK